MTSTLVLEPVTVESSWVLAAVPADPASLEVAVMDPTSAILTYVAGVDVEVVHDATGEYHVDVVPTIEGEWRYLWTASGVDDPTQEGRFTVSQEVETTLDILKAPVDFDAIRALLGVDDVDLKAAIIELPIYGPYVESRVKSIVLDWQVLLADPDISVRLRTAVIYGVAASLAETYMKGGTVSLVHKEEPRRNWSEWARILLNRYREAMARVTSPAGINDDEFDVDPQTLAGPGRSRGRAPDWRTVYPPMWP